MDTSGAGGGGDSSRKPKDFELRAGKKSLTPSDSESDVDLVSLRRPRAEVDDDLMLCCSDVGKKNISRLPKNCEGSRTSGKRIACPDTGRCGQDGGNGHKRDAKLGMERYLDGGEDDGIPLKKIKVYSLELERDKADDTDVKSFGLDSVSCDTGKALIRASLSQGLKQVKADEENLSDNRKQACLEGNISPEADQTKSSQKMFRMPKCSSSLTNDQQFSVSQDGGGIRVQRKGGVLKVLHSNKKFNDQDRNFVKRISEGTRKSPRLSATFVCDDWSTLNHSPPSEPQKSLKKPDLSSITEETRMSTQSPGIAHQTTSKDGSPNQSRKVLKKRGSSSSLASSVSNAGHSAYADQSTLMHIPLSEFRESLKKSGSSMLQKSRMRLRKVSSSKGSKAPEVKKVLAKTSPKMESENADNLCNKVEDKERMPGGFITKAPLSSKNSRASEHANGGTERQKLRDRIKSMLLNAGWKIDMRPRRGRNYEDSVYISPQGSPYWSITKAYSVLEEQFKKEEEIGNKKDKELCGQLSKPPSKNIKGAAYQFSAIPLDVLGMLKRVVVKKRRRRIEENATILPERGCGSKKRKYAASLKSSKTKAKVVVAEKEINGNGIVGSRRKKNKNRRGCALLARTANHEADSEGDGYVPFVGRRSVLAWMIDSGSVPENGKVKYMNRRQTQAMLGGLITRDGIHCSCCSKILTVSKFEIHAGSKLKQPYANMFVEGSGISLLQCQLDAWKKQDESQRCAFHLIGVSDDDPNDDTCGICGDGGNLICCDSCPSTFHLSCLGIQMLPPGEWQCMNCLCRFCGEADSNAAEGNHTSGSLLLSCGQCGRKYHQVCISEVVANPVDTDSSSLSFCGQSCRTLFNHLENLLGVKNDLEEGFSWTLVKRLDDDSLESSSKLVQWAECNSKVAVALAVMDECFLPITDQRSGINLIHNVLYNCGSNFIRLNHSGFYTFILERGDEIISAASIRIHGTSLAEMPFIGTRNIYRRQGMCRRLLNAIEVALASLKIEKLVIPAISELMHTWTMVFGFKPLDDSDKQEIKNLNMLVFPDTGLLQKPLVGLESNTVEGGAIYIQNDMLLVASESSDLRASNNDSVSCSSGGDEIEIIKPSCPAVNGSVLVAPEVSYQPSKTSCDAPCGSCIEAFRYNPLEHALDEAHCV